MIWRADGELTTLQHVSRHLPPLTSRRLIWLAGLILATVGIVCLILSGAVVSPGWWQGTLQAFGVGFTVGGAVDVVAISLLGQVVTKSGLEREADRILSPDSALRWGPREQADRAAALLDRDENLLDPRRRRELWALRRAGYSGSNPPNPQAVTSGHDEAPPAGGAAPTR